MGLNLSISIMDIIDINYISATIHIINVIISVYAECILHNLYPNSTALITKRLMYSTIYLSSFIYDLYYGQYLYVILQSISIIIILTGLIWFILDLYGYCPKKSDKPRGKIISIFDRMDEIMMETNV